MTSTWAAPGRVNLIGEHVDYNDGLVLPFALPFVTTARVAARSDDAVKVASEDVGEAEFATTVSPGDVEEWVAYVAGIVWALRQRGTTLPGLDIALSSNVPLGAGLSSSASLTCSVASAINDECSLGFDARELADVSRIAENDFVGVPTGTMDQLASMLCQSEHLLLLDCRSMETRLIPFAPSASGLTLLLIDSQARHSLVGSEYGDRRRDCEAAADALGVDSLRDATLDQATSLSDDRLRRRASHVVSEIDRVQRVSAVLDTGSPADIGAHLTASHQSMRDDFEISCEELDVLVDAALFGGALGARMTGGGFGGCAVVLCRKGDVESVTSRVQSAYDERGWEQPMVWTPEPAQGAHRIN